MSEIELALLAQRCGRLDEANERLADALAHAAESRDPGGEGIASSMLAQTELLRGRYADALAHAAKAEELARRLGDSRLLTTAVATRARVLARCGRTAEASELLAPLIAHQADDSDPLTTEVARLALVEAAILAEGPDDARADDRIEGALERVARLDDPDLWPWAVALEAARRALPGEHEPVDEMLRELEALAERGSSWSPPFARAAVELAAARAALRDGDGAAAAERATAAAETAQRCACWAEAAEAAAVQAASLRQEGLVAEAGEARARGRRWLDRAADRVGDAALRRGFLAAPRFAELLRPEVLASSSLDRRLVALYEMIRQLNSEHDPEALLGTILDMALRTVDAERGLILLVGPDGGSTVRIARHLEPTTAAEVEAFSRSVVAEAGRGESILTIDAASDARLHSISLQGVRSLMCVPLRSRGRITGSVYLDDSREERVFTREDLRFVEAFANHAAIALDNARVRTQLVVENRALQAAAEERVEFGNLVGESPGMRRVFELIETVAASDLPVLIHGESGTGKELVARAIHYHGPRRKRSFVSENCAALPESLLQSELFGHVRGAFTGAARDRAGLFEQADGGTLLLDEIGDTAPAMQAQLLRVIEDGEVRRVGGDRPVRIDVRVLAATHRDLAERVAAGRFREDLMYRLQVLVIRVPPLRERAGDVPLLTRFFLQRIAAARGRAATTVDDEVLQRLSAHPWPGNVRQLENVLQRLSLLAGDGPLRANDLDRDPALARLGVTKPPSKASPSLSLGQSERERIRQALSVARGNRSRAARLLGVSRATIYRKLKEFDL